MLKSSCPNFTKITKFKKYFENTKLTSYSPEIPVWFSKKSYPAHSRRIQKIENFIYHHKFKACNESHVLIQIFGNLSVFQYSLRSIFCWIMVFRLPYIDRIDQIRIKMNLIIILTIFEKSTSWRRYENSRLKAFKKNHETKNAIKTRRCIKNLPICRIYSGKSFRTCSKRELYFFYLRFLLQQCEVYRKYYWYWHFFDERSSKVTILNSYLLLPYSWNGSGY